MVTSVVVMIAIAANSTTIRPMLDHTIVRRASSRSANAPPNTVRSARGNVAMPITMAAPCAPPICTEVQASPISQAASPACEMPPLTTHAWTRRSRPSGGIVSSAASCSCSRARSVGSADVTGQWESRT